MTIALILRLSSHLPISYNSGERNSSWYGRRFTRKSHSLPGFLSFRQDGKGWSEILDKNVGKAQATQSIDSGCLQKGEQ